MKAFSGQWRRLLACGLAAAVLAAGVGVAARGEGEKPTPKKEEKAKQKAADPFAGVNDLLNKMGPGPNDEQFKAMRARMEEMRKRMEKTMLQMQKGGGLGVFPGMPMMPGFGNLSGGPRERSGVQEPRLGVQVRKPSKTLEDQLDLPKDQGLVLEEVGANSAAAKAGLKAHDILLELNGKPVPSKKDDFAKLLQDVKPGKAVDVVVMRKGRKETIKGLALPEAKVEAPAPRPNLFPGAGGGLMLGGFGGLGGGATSISRSNDAFTATNSAGGVSITVKGKVEAGKAQVSEVSVTQDGKTKTYASLDKTPAEHRERAKRLAETAAGGGLRFALPRLGD